MTDLEHTEPIDKEGNTVKLKRTLLAAVAVLALATTACGGGTSAGAAEGGGGGGDLTLKTTEFKFAPGTLSATAGAPVTITVDNSKGVVEHDFTLEEEGVHIHADAGKTVSGTVELPAGTYTFFCSVPGHRAGGMEGTLEVK